MLGGIITGLTKLHVHVCGAECMHRDETAEPAPAPCGLVSVLGWGHFQPRAASSPAGKSPVLARAAEVIPDLKPGRSCRIRGSCL